MQVSYLFYNVIKVNVNKVNVSKPVCFIVYHSVTHSAPQNAEVQLKIINKDAQDSGAHLNHA